MEYAFVKGFPRRGMDPDAVGNELERLEGKLGPLTPDQVVEAARKKRSSMHKAFEWDDSKAAILGRRAQAKSLLGGIIVIIEDQEPIRKFIKVVTRPENPEDKVSGYVTLAAAMSDKDQRKAILLRAKRELASFARKYKGLKELASVISVIESL